MKKITLCIIILASMIMSKCKNAEHFDKIIQHVVNSTDHSVEMQIFHGGVFDEIYQIAPQKK